jgi:hypothetical protein
VSGQRPASRVVRSGTHVGPDGRAVARSGMTHGGPTIERAERSGVTHEARWQSGSEVRRTARRRGVG